MNRFISKTFCLIPKKDKANWVKDFRPISLITSVYKILAKVLANHLRKVLPSTISDSQGAFIVGRKILDQALLTYEAVEDYRAKRKEGVVFKIDFEKAHDHVDWDFLDKVMDEKGSGYKWRMWMWSCVRNVSYSILVNGTPKGSSKASRG